MSCDVGHKCGLGLVLLWLWCRSAAEALIQTLAWEHPRAVGVAQKKKAKKKKIVNWFQREEAEELSMARRRSIVAF